MEDKKPFVNCKKTKLWKMTNEQTGTYSSTVTIDLEDRLTTYTDNVSVNSTPLYGDGKMQDNAVAEGAGTLQLGVHHIADSERIDLYGEENVNGTSVSTGHNVAPYFCVALMAEKRNGNVNLRKFFKTQFAPHEETVTQQQDNGITYSMPTLQGTYFENTVTGRKAARVEADPKTAQGQALIANWFSIPEYIGEHTVLNTSAIKVGNTVIPDGGEIASGSTVTFNGSASGGTAPLKYSFYLKAEGSNTWTTVAEDSSTATATQSVSVVSDTVYIFRSVITDGNGVTIAKEQTATVAAGD